MDEVTADVYSQGLRDAQQVQHKELSGALREMQKAEQRYYNAKGWCRGFFGPFSMLSHTLFQYFSIFFNMFGAFPRFWSCDAKCEKAYDKYNMAKRRVSAIETLTLLSFS